MKYLVTLIIISITIPLWAEESIVLAPVEAYKKDLEKIEIQYTTAKAKYIKACIKRLKAAQQNALGKLKIQLANDIETEIEKLTKSIPEIPKTAEQKKAAMLKKKAEMAKKKAALERAREREERDKAEAGK